MNVMSPSVLASASPDQQGAGIEAGDPRRDTAAFRRCLGQFATGITVITARVGDDLVGMTANSFSSVSLDPPLVLWSAKLSSASFAKFEAAEYFAVNILSRDQVAASKHFGKSGDEKFRDLPWSAGLGGAPLLEGSLATFECRRCATYPGGDHLIILGEVERFARYNRGALLFVQGRYSVAEDYPDLHAAGEAPGAHRPPGPMDEFMTALLYRAHGVLSGLLETGRRAEGLTTLQSRVMAAVQTLPERTTEELLPDLFLGRNAADETVADLIGMEIIARDDAGRLSMTAHGREWNRRLLARAAAIESHTLSSLSEGDIAACRRVLKALVNQKPASVK